MIDYIFVNKKIKEKVIGFRIKERVNSDHMPICLELEVDEERRGEERGKRRKEEIEEKKIICWDEEARKIYQDKSNEIGWEERQKKETINRIWEKLKELVNRSMVHKIKEFGRKDIGHKDW